MKACSWDQHFGIMEKWTRVGDVYTDEGRVVVYECPRCHKQTSIPIRRGSVEFVSQETKNQRQEFAKSLIQPWRGGHPSREFMEAYPKQASKMFSKKEQRTAKNVWKDTLPSNWEKTK
jgi:hypothetical protein